MRPYAPVAPLTADDRRHEIAAILAAGLLRLRERPVLNGPSAGPEPTKNPPESVQPGLELPGVLRLSVHPG